MADDNVATVRSVYEAMATRDVDTILDLFADDVTIYQTPELPWGGRRHGRDSVLEFFGALISSIESQLTTEKMYAAGDHVVQMGRTRGTVVANGASFDVAEVHIWGVGGGKIVSFEAYIDTPAMLAALNA